MFLHSGLKDRLLQICVRARVWLCVRSESAIMRIISESWERAVPGCHTQTLSLTSTGRTGGPGWGDYVSGEAPTETRSNKKTYLTPSQAQKETTAAVSCLSCWSKSPILFHLKPKMTLNLNPSCLFFLCKCTINCLPAPVSLSLHVRHICTSADTDIARDSSTVPPFEHDVA